MSNCVVASDDCGTPLGVVTKHGVEGYNHLAHYCDDDDLSLFAGGGEAPGEGFERRIVSARAQLRGMELRREGWAPLLDDQDRSGSLVAIFALAHEHDPDPELRSYDKPITPELRERLLLGVAVGVMQIHRYFETRSLMPTMPTRKVGRNDPCPCGSGKKYKQCCGRITLH